MQPQNPTPTPRPVMDVQAPPKSPAPASAPAAPLQSVPVKQAPAEATAPASAPEERPTSPLPKLEDQPAEKAEVSKTDHKVPHNTPVGLIIVTLIVMTGLSGLAILIYLNS